mmetsp:Transcript_4106/g.9947  ORF Transcript_4106/g.9947 Transcript_4106/m.9947 type:complete len:274 (-) Transcript_4106:68-889(-)
MGTILLSHHAMTSRNDNTFLCAIYTLYGISATLYAHTAPVHLSVYRDFLNNALVPQLQHQQLVLEHGQEGVDGHAGTLHRRQVPHNLVPGVVVEHHHPAPPQQLPAHNAVRQHVPRVVAAVHVCHVVHAGAKLRHEARQHLHGSPLALPHRVVGVTRAPWVHPRDPRDVGVETRLDHVALVRVSVQVQPDVAVLDAALPGVHARQGGVLVAAQRGEQPLAGPALPRPHLQHVLGARAHLRRPAQDLEHAQQRRGVVREPVGGEVRPPGRRTGR